MGKDLKVIANLKGEIKARFDFSQPVHIVWDDMKWNAGKHGPIEYRGSEPLYLDYSARNGAERCFLVFRESVPKDHYDKINSFDGFYPQDFVGVLDRLMEEAGEGGYLSDIDFDGDITVKSFFREKTEWLFVMANVFAQPPEIIVSDDQPNTLIVRGEFDLSSHFVDQGGQAGNFG